MVNSGDVAVIITVSANGKCYQIKKIASLARENRIGILTNFV